MMRFYWLVTSAPVSIRSDVHTCLGLISTERKLRPWSTARNLSNCQQKLKNSKRRLLRSPAPVSWT